MRVVVVGGTGNVGSSVLRALADERSVDDLVGVSRRAPVDAPGGASWVAADITADNLEHTLQGADAVVHLAWALQPQHGEATLHRVNVIGTERLLQAVAAAGVPVVLYASSVGAYSPAPPGIVVDETWPTHGVPTCIYSRQKAYVERLFDRFQDEQPSVRVVRMRPGLIFQRAAGSEIRRLFLGPVMAPLAFRLAWLSLLPDLGALSFQVVHSDDVGDAFRRALLEPVQGPFNLAADPVLTMARLASTFGARLVPLPTAWARLGASVSWKLHLQPTEPGWLDLAVESPLLDCTRARDELGWTPRWTAEEALADMVGGMRSGAGAPTASLRPDAVPAG